MSKVKDGIVRFRKEVHEPKKELFEKLSHGQHPEALFITCSDSRIDPNLLVQTEPGELFIIRNAGNIVPPYNNQTGGVTASIEYAVAVLQLRHIIVCGHSGCGAMEGVMKPSKTAGLPHVTQWLSYAAAARQIVVEKYPDADERQFIALLTEQNVLLQKQHLLTHPQVAAKLATGKLEVHAWCYDIGQGQVRAFSDAHQKFLPVDEVYQDEAREFIKRNMGSCANH
jgi:carbonic anhydrase